MVAVLLINFDVEVAEGCVLVGASAGISEDSDRENIPFKTFVEDK